MAVDVLTRRDAGLGLEDAVEIGQIGEPRIQRSLEDVARLQEPALREAHAGAADVASDALAGAAAKDRRVVARAEPGDVGEFGHLDPALDMGLDVSKAGLEPVAADAGRAPGAQPYQAAVQQRQQGEEPPSGGDAPGGWTRDLAPQYSAYGTSRLDDVVRGVQWRACRPQVQKILEERRSV